MLNFDRFDNIVSLTAFFTSLIKNFFMEELRKDFIDYYNKVNGISVVESDDDDLELIDEEEFWSGVNDIIEEIYGDEE